jgi:Type IV secretion system pilin
MKYIRTIILSLALVVGVAMLFSPVVGAVDVFEPCAAGAGSDSAVCASTGEQATDTIEIVVETLLYLLGIAAVIVIIIAGVIYATSAGDSNAIGRAKSMLLYAVIGLVVAISAYAIVNFVLGRFS